MFAGLVPGRTYTFYVRDAAGCVRQNIVNVNDLITQPLDVTSVITPSCNGSSNGSIVYTITENTASPGTEMQWSFYDISSGTPVLVGDSGGNVPFSAPQTITFNTLGAGDYYLEVVKMDGAVASCISASENEFLEELDALSGTPTVLQDIACDRPGLIEIPDINGGGDTYYYDVTGPVPFTTISGTLDNPIEIPANSPSGSYTIVVTDEYGCSSSLGSVNLNLAANPTIDNIAVANCDVQADVIISASSTAAQILYSIDGGTNYENNGGVFNNVFPGTYTISILDSNGCTDTDTVTVQPQLQVTTSLTETLGCGAGNEAEITIDVTNGSGNYDYEILGTSSTLVARQSLTTNPTVVQVATADTYTISVFDINTSGPECSRIFTIEVPAAVQPDFTANPFDVSCSGSANGSIAITEINNGINPLSYTLNPNISPFNPATNSFENLPQGTYEVIAVGQNGCSTTLSNIVVDEPNPITFDVPTVTAFGCSAGNSNDNATISVDTGSILGGSGNYIRFEFINDTTSAVLQSGSESTYIHTDFDQIDVQVWVFDDQGCSAQSTVSIPAYDELQDATIHIDDAIGCSNAGEDISISVTGRLTTFASDPTNYEFRLLPSTVYQGSNQFLDLPAGNHAFGVRNVITGCELVINHIVEEPNTFDVTVEKLTDAICFGDDGSIRLSITDPTYSNGFNWSIFNTNGTPTDRSDDGVALLTGNTPNVGPTLAIAVPAGEYLVEVTQDTFPGCSQIRSFSITTPTAPISLNPIELIEVGCSNDQGSALVDPEGGEGPYTINLTHQGTGATIAVSSVNSHLFQSLSSGQYAITVIDNRGCSETFANAFELLLPDPITGSIANTDLVCQGDTDASVSISLNPRNISVGYRFILNTYDDALGTTILSTSSSQTNQAFDNLGAGFYSIMVLDDIGCSFETAVVEIVDPTDVQAQLVTNQSLTCQLEAELLLFCLWRNCPLYLEHRWGDF